MYEYINHVSVPANMWPSYVPRDLEMDTSTQIWNILEKHLVYTYHIQVTPQGHTQTNVKMFQF